MSGPGSAPSNTFDLESGTERGSIDDVQVPASATSSPTVETRPYDSAPVTDEARKRIGYALLALLFLIVLGAFFELMRINTQLADQSTGGILAADAKADGERLVSIINIVFGPVVTLLGSVTGFYFGTQSARSGSIGSGGGGSK
jgi:hypothetical protein